MVTGSLASEATRLWASAEGRRRQQQRQLPAGAVCCRRCSGAWLCSSGGRGVAGKCLVCHELYILFGKADPEQIDK